MTKQLLLGLFVEYFFLRVGAIDNSGKKDAIVLRYEGTFHPKFHVGMISTCSKRCVLRKVEVHFDNPTLFERGNFRRNGMEFSYIEMHFISLI